MPLNGLKFEHMLYGKNEELKPYSVYYSDTQDQIETKSQVKDLGVTLDVDMSYKGVKSIKSNLSAHGYSAPSRQGTLMSC